MINESETLTSKSTVPKLIYSLKKKIFTLKVFEYISSKIEIHFRQIL